MEFLKWSNDKQRMQELLREGSAYENISTSAALVLKSQTNIKIRINQNKETTDMCKAIQEMQQEAVEKAVGEAVEKAVGETAVSSLLKTARALMANLSWSADQALQAMSVSESECATLKPMLQA